VFILEIYLLLDYPFCTCCSLHSSKDPRDSALNNDHITIIKEVSFSRVDWPSGVVRYIDTSLQVLLAWLAVALGPSSSQQEDIRNFIPTFAQAT
jgi:hypothetical protein